MGQSQLPGIPRKIDFYFLEGLLKKMMFILLRSGVNPIKETMSLKSLNLSQMIFDGTLLQLDQRSQTRGCCVCAARDIIKIT